MGRPKDAEVNYYDKKLRWFDIEQYEPFRLNKLSPLNWLEQISFRRYVLNQLELYPRFVSVI